MSAKNLDNHKRKMEKYHSRVSCISRRKRTDKQGGKVIGITEAGILLSQMFRSGYCCSGESESI